MLRSWIKYIGLLFICSSSFAQIEQIKDEDYEKAFTAIKRMLVGNEKTSFKRAVFETENAYLSGNMNYSWFENELNKLSILTHAISKASPLRNYPFEDSAVVQLNQALFLCMTDTFTIKDKSGEEVIHLPFEYDFKDFFGKKQWEKMFVSKLLLERKGNCHSMPYLYKMLADEIGTKAYLAFAPNHIYIKQRSKKAGWYNTELTSRMFPIDAWIMASGYVSTETIVNGIYMDTLSNKQSVAICLNDLALGHQRKFGVKQSVDFTLNCTELALKYYPNYANGLLLHAETLKQKVENKMENDEVLYPKEVMYDMEIKNAYTEMEQTYVHLAKLGYREVPEHTYLQWLSELVENKDKYQNELLDQNK